MDNTEQLLLPFDKTEPIETVIVEINKEMPLGVFKSFNHIAYFMELMERLPDGRVIWDETLVSIYSEDLAEAEYIAMQKEWIKVRMELPAALFED